MARPAAAPTTRSAVLCFDVISPYAFILCEMLARDPLPIPLQYRPVLLAGLLDAAGNKGPAEIPRKRVFAYQHCTWLGAVHGIPFVTPRAHPFNPLRYLRLVLALQHRGDAVTEVFRVLYQGGGDPRSDEAWQDACARLGLMVSEAQALVEQAAVKAQLRENTQWAVGQGVFGVPSLLIDDALFWGVDALPMAREYALDAALLDSPAMQRAKSASFGALRKEH